MLAFGAVARRSGRLTPLVAQGGKGSQNGVEEPADEDTLPATLGADIVEAVVPVAAPDERQAVRAGGERPIHGPEAVLEQRARFAGDGREPVRLGLSRRNGRRLQERHPLVEDGAVPSGLNVLGSRVGEPEQIVRATRTNALAARGVPPVLNVPLHELARGRSQEVLAREVRPREHERQHVLELVAKAIRTARLGVAGARPDTARQILVEEPPVNQEVEGVVGCGDAHGAQRVVPEFLHRDEFGVGSFRAVLAREPPHKPAGFGRVPPLPEEEHDAPRRAGLEVHHRLQGCARVEADAEPV